MKRGFTLIEILVVVTVISILSSIGIFAFNAVRNQASDGATQSLANSVKAAAERYYNTNNEYPLASALGATTTETPPSSYTAASTLLGMRVDQLSGNGVRLVPCYNATRCSTPYVDKRYVYYVTKATSTEAGTTRSIAFTQSSGTCTYSLLTAQVGPLAYLIAYWSNADGRWNVMRSNNGEPTTSSTTTCKFI